MPQKFRTGDKPLLRELNGIEFRAIVLEDLCTQFRAELERQLDATNRFYIGNSYPVVTVRGSIAVKVMPREKLPEPMLIPIIFDYGVTLDSALDRIREAHGIEVLQPQKTKSGLIVNQPVEDRNGKG